MTSSERLTDGRPVVVDANVVVYMLLAGERSSEARWLHEVHPDWVCPSILRHELLNVWATYHRRGGISREDCRALVEAGVALLPGREIEVDPLMAVGVAMDLEISAYDAQYVAAALALSGVLVTEDQRLLSRAPDVTRSLAQYGG